MKNIFRIAAVLSLAAGVCLTSCKVDNYNQPDSSLYGVIFDAETGDPIPQDIGDQGSQIQIAETAYAEPSYRYLNFKTDGSYRENNLFSGEYVVKAEKNINFVPVEERVIKVKGQTRVDFESVPYIRVLTDSIVYNQKKKRVEAVFHLQNGDPSFPVVKTIGLFCQANKNVSFSINDDKVTQDLNQNIDPGKTYTLNLDVSIFKEGTYYFRVGALTVASEARYNYDEAVALTIVKPEEEAEELPGIEIDNCNSIEGWSGNSEITLDPEHRTGVASIATTAEGIVFFKKTFATPIDVTAYPEDCAALQVTLYVSDASKIPANVAGQIEITSSGLPDDGELCWTFNKFSLTNGWNVLRLPFKSASKGGQINLAAINFFRIYHAEVQDKSVIIKLDDIRVIYPTQFDNCEDEDAWKASAHKNFQAYTALDEVNYKEGNGSISVNNAPMNGTVQVFKYVKPEPYAVPGGVNLLNGHVKFWLYSSVALKDIQANFELTSSGKSDENELQIRRKLTLDTGWNKIDLPFNECSTSATLPDLTSLNYCRLHFEGMPDGVYTMKIDDIEIYKEGYEPGLDED